MICSFDPRSSYERPPYQTDVVWSTNKDERPFKCEAKEQKDLGYGESNPELPRSNERR